MEIYPLSCWGGCLIISTWCNREILFEQKKIKLLNKVSFEENITEIRHHVLKMQYISVLPKHTR
jgi:hypothetical protein